MRTRAKSIIGTCIGFGLMALVGCASAPAPSAKLASARAAIRAAREAGASENPRAELHLRLARDQYTAAEKLVREDENERAASLLERAEADAELAFVLAREEATRREATREVEQVRQLRRSAGR